MSIEEQKQLLEDLIDAFGGPYQRPPRTSRPSFILTSR